MDDTSWIGGIDVCEYHSIDFRELRADGVEVAVLRAGRGTRQDARWIESVRAASLSGLQLASFWHVYPSATGAHHQAELWAAALRAAPSPLAYGHWADVTTSDGFDPFDLGRYVAAFLRRADELIGGHVGLFTSEHFWTRHVHFDDVHRPRWIDVGEPERDDTFGMRTSPSDRGGPGRHRVRRRHSGVSSASMAERPHLVPRGPAEPLEQWRARWIRTPDVAFLQTMLNELGAGLVVDGVFGPATDAAVRTCELLLRRDRISAPIGA
ncbi:MAG: GH25 family lysozyme [Ilumatobacteraceae bacterium]